MPVPGNLRMMVKYCTVVLIAVTICAAGASALTKASTPIYRAQASLYFSLDVNKSATDLNQGSTYLQSQMPSFAQLATSPKVLTPVISELHLNLTDSQLAGSISVSTPANTVILQVNAASPSGRMAADIANSVASYTRQAVQEAGPKDATGTPIVLVQPIESAILPDSPSSPNDNLNLTVGVLLGVLLGVLTLIVWRTYDKKVRYAADIDSLTATRILGSVEKGVRSEEMGGLMIQNPSGPEAEEYRRLRENLRAVIGRQDVVSIVLTSVRSTGPSTVPYELGLAFAETGASVLVVDADLRKGPRTVTGAAEPQRGLARFLTDENVDLDDAIQRDSGLGFDVLSSGGGSKNPGKLVASSRMSDLVKALQSQYEVIIISCAPARTAADASVLAGLTAGVVLTVEPGRTRQPQLIESVNVLQSSGALVLGAVVTRHRRKWIKRSIPSAMRTKLHGTRSERVPE